MKISNETLSVLKNFSTINTGIAVGVGNILKTVSSQKNILAQATVSETFDKEFAIYDLNQFLATLSLFDKPDLSFGDKSVAIASGRNTSRYFYTDKTMIVTPPDKDLSPLFASPDISIKATSGNITEVLRAASVLALPEVAVVGNEGQTIELVAFDAKNSTSNTFSVEVDEVANTNFKMIFKTENLKMMPGDYTVDIVQSGISRWTGKSATYYITTEATSTYTA